MRLAFSKTVSLLSLLSVSLHAVRCLGSHLEPRVHVEENQGPQLPGPSETSDGNSPSLPAPGVDQLESRSSAGQGVPANATWNKDEVSQTDLDL